MAESAEILNTDKHVGQLLIFCQNSGINVWQSTSKLDSQLSFISSWRLTTDLCNIGYVDNWPVLVTDLCQQLTADNRHLVLTTDRPNKQGTVTHRKYVG